MLLHIIVVLFDKFDIKYILLYFKFTCKPLATFNYVYMLVHTVHLAGLYDRIDLLQEYSYN